MIAVECRGRLGNQMFQYAFGLAASRLLDTELVIDDRRLRELFVLSDRDAHAAPPTSRKMKVENDDYDEPEEILSRLEDDTTYAGYFQSERFFAAAADEARRSFRLRPEHVDAFTGKYPDLVDRPYVCCHMRRTDYHAFAGGVALPMSYYVSALAHASDRGGAPIVFVGDDLDEARSAFAGVPGTRFEQNDEAVDLQLLLHASTVVVSNSTFAWWGAWLNERPDKRVLAPRLWLGFRFGWEYPPRIVPSGWAQLRVRLPWRARLAPARMRMSLGHTRRRMTARAAKRS